MYLGDFPVGQTLDHYFTTRRFSTGAPFTLAGTPVISAYEDNSTIEITAGVTLTVDFDARTGLNQVRVVATGANGFETGKSYYLVITAGTVDSVSVVGEVIGSFTLERGAAFGRLGAPAGASIAADLVVIDNFVDDIEARLPAALVSGRMDSSVGAMAANVVTSSAVAAAALNGKGDWNIGKTGYALSAAGIQAIWDALTSALVTAGSIGKLLVDNINAAISSRATQTSVDTIDDFVDTEVADIQTRLPAALVGGRMDASVGAYAAGMTPTRPSASGTADSGSTTTLVDAERTEADTDYWRNCILKFTSGTLNGQTALITAFNAATDTITFAPATTVAVGTHAYEIYAMSRVDVHLWLGALVNALVSGRVDAIVGAYASGQAPLQPTVAGRTLDVTATGEAGLDLDNTAGTLSAAEIPNLDAAVSTRATPAQVNIEVLDVLNTDTFAEPGQEAPPATTTLVKKIGYLYKFLRNKITQDATTLKVFADDATTVDQKATVSDDGTTYTRNEVGTGP